MKISSLSNQILKHKDEMKEMKEMKEMRRMKLTNENIEFVFQDCVSFFPNYLNKELHENIILKMIEKLKRELCGLEMYPSEIHVLKQEIEKKLFRSILCSGSSVGLLSAQSIGSISTQMTLNSFHSSGLALSLVVSGVPRLLELLNTTKKQKILSSSFKMKKEYNKNINYIKQTIGSNLKEIRLKDLIDKTTITEKRGEIWYDAFFNFFPTSKNIEESRGCISFTLKKDIIFRYRLSLLKIKESIESRFEGCNVVFSPLHIAQLDVFLFFDLTNPYDYISIEENLQLFYIDSLRKKIEMEIIFGIKGINDYYINKNTENEYIVDTNGSNMKEILQLPYVEKQSISTNNLWEVLSISGIEGVRLFLFEEMKKILENINDKHIMILVDTMTYSGNLHSISRYSMKKDRTSVLSRSSFEESLDHFTRASFYGEVEPVQSVSSNIILGSQIKNIGTGKTHVIPDWSKLF